MTKKVVPLRMRRAMIAFYKALYTEKRAGKYVKVDYEIGRMAVKLEMSKATAWSIIRQWRDAS